MDKYISLHTGRINAHFSLQSEPPSKYADLNKNRHCHDWYEILFILRGEGTFIIEGSRYKISPRTLFLVRPFEYHCLELDPGTEYERYVVNFPRDVFPPNVLPIFDSMMSDGDASGKYYSLVNLSDEMMSCFERLLGASNLPPKERDIYLCLVLSEICVRLSLYDGERMTHYDYELGARVIRYLNENISRDISLDKLARRFFVSKYYLCRAFKKHNGISVHGYINQKRVMYAKQLIENGETASGAAYKVGFGDYSAFYRAYVKIVGRAPTANSDEAIGKEV